MKSISVLMKPSSSLCNMRCDYCFYCDEAEKRGQSSYGFMSEKTLKNVIRKTILQADKSAAYAFQGGEPTLRGIEFFRKAVAYQKQYNKKGIQVSNAFQTNGYGINEEWCRFFKENHFLVGVSVDGPACLHDTYRHSKKGENTYQRIEHSLELLTKFGVDFNILTVVTEKTAERAEEVYEYYKKKGWLYQQYIPCLNPLGEMQEKYTYSLSPDKYGHFLVKLFECWYRDLKKGKQPYIRQFENYIAMAAGYMPEACDQRGTCGIQNVVEADGSVYPCDFYVLDEYYLGNFNINRIEDIYKKRAKLQFIEHSLRLSERCIQCRYYRLCRGGCQRNREWNADTQVYENYFCEGYRFFWEKYYEVFMELGEYVRASSK